MRPRTKTTDPTAAAGPGIKRHTYLSITCVLVLAIAGCGGGGSSGSGSSSGSGTSESTTSSGSTDAVTLNWVAPTTREDGSALSLSRIDGYNVYSGPSADDLSKRSRIDDSTATSYTIEDLDPGTYYFAVSTVDASETEGPRSTVVSTTVE